MNDKITTKVVKKYDCETCYYSSSRKTDFNKHLATHKHKIVTNSYNLTTNVVKNGNNWTTTIKENCYECECGKTYKHRQNLHTHKKKCTFQEKKQNESLVELNNMDYKDLFMKMIHENQELRDQVTGLIPKVGNTIHNKQRFNINIFLNEKCKDALTMNEFIDKIKVTLDDLLITKNKGLTEGVSNIFIENMNKLAVHERPMHCTDVKRETVYIKCEDKTNNNGNSQWEKDKENRKLKKALNQISQVQQKNLIKWTEEHPDWKDNQSLQEEYMTLIKNCTDDLKENKREDKAIKNVCNKLYLGEAPNILL